MHAPKQAPVDQVRSFMEDGVSGLRALHLGEDHEFLSLVRSKTKNKLKQSFKY